MKKSFLTFLIIFTCAFVFAQDIIYTVSGELNSVKTPLDSIVVENLTTGKRTRFGNLPVKNYYQINLTKNAYWGTVGIDNLNLPVFGEVQNLPGLLSVTFFGNSPEKVKVTVYNTIGQLVYSGSSKTVSPGNTVEIKLANEGLYFVVIETPDESKTIKALGSLSVADFGEVVSERAQLESKLKSGAATTALQSNFMQGDSVRVSVYKSGYYARPQGAKIVNSIPMNFPFQISTVALTGTSDGYVELHPMTTDVTAFDTISGKVQIKYSGESPNLRPGNVITVDMDTIGYLRKVVSTTVNGNVITGQTVPAYMNEIFVDKEIKLNTGLMNPGVQLKSTASMVEISKALTDKDGYIHPAAVYYHTGNGQVITKSAFTTAQEGAETVPLFNFGRDLKSDLYGKSGDNAHLYISEGYDSLRANAVFEMAFDHEKELDADTKIRKGDLRYFKFYLEGKAGFQTKLALDLSKSFEKEDDKKLSTVGKVTAKFLVGAVPVWITFGADIYGKYNVSADASLHADWGFESTHTVQVGGTYTKATDSFVPFKSYTPVNKVYPLNLEGQVNASARFEVYPRTEVKFYGFFGPYMEIVPYVEGKYNARMQSQITSTGAENFLAWNSGIDLGLDFRVGTELTFLWGLFDKEFGPTVINGPVWQLWKSPFNITLLSSLPAEAGGGTVVPLKFKVTDRLENPVILCPIYIKGGGTYSKQMIFTDTSGEATVNWTVGSTASDNSFTAIIYNADKSVNKEFTKTVKVGLAPVADFTVSKTSISIGETVQFTDKSTNAPTSWLWNFGDGTTSNQQSLSKTYSNAGTYTVSLKATNSFGNNSKTMNITVTESGGANETGSFTDPRDGKTYKWVKIGTQIWMAENLAYLPVVYLSTSESASESRYYVYEYNGNNVATAKQQANYKTFGVLYNWAAAKVACPPGWHLPSNAEWTDLENYLIVNGYNYDGTTTGDKIAKSMAATMNWSNSSVIGAIGNNLILNNKSGFSALPGGARSAIGFSAIGIVGGWWTSTDYSTDGALTRWLNFDSNVLGGFGSSAKKNGLSVRCIKDK